MNGVLYRIYRTTFLLCLILLLPSCSPVGPPEKTVNGILDLAADRDFSGLIQMAPFLGDLSPEEQNTIAEILDPYCRGTREMTVNKQSLKSVTVYLSTGNKGDKTLIMTLIRGKERDWILSENISYRQSFDFIPLEKQE